ncbi:MAG TPA: DUF3857 domain-containing protein [Acidobacteriaceae bacterium]|jgi:hypothetical protein
MKFLSSYSSIARRTLPAFVLSTALVTAAVARAETKFIDPTPDELSMTALPGYPGVAAVILNKEEISKDDLHSASHYARIKILTEDGKKYANVELPFVSTNDDFEYGANGVSLDSIEGRTIHPDGTIIPFTGKPYLKVIEKEKGVKVQAKVFTLPDVTVGSIIEYRYATRIADHLFDAPDWIIQGALYVKSAHFMWYPTTRDIEDPKWGPINSISWFPILPQGAKIDSRELPATGPNGIGQRIYELSIKEVPPEPDEEYMPPSASYTYAVYFNFSSFHDFKDYWKNTGKDWSKRANSFANPNSDLRDAVQKITAGLSTNDGKLRAIYAAVMNLENTDFTREREQREDKANGLAQPKNAADVFHNGRGDSGQLTRLFVGMARAAGFDADLMLVPDRTHHLFTPYWMNFSQFDDTIAVVNVDGKEVYFDPGSRYCAYGHLAWQHTFIEGLRQKGSETVFEQTTGDNYTANITGRIANLKIDDAFHVTGKIDLSFTGSPALRWRQAALRGDDESLKHQLRTHLEDMLPHSLEVKDVTIQNLTDYEKPLTVSYQVDGTLGTATGKRLLLPADIFLANTHATFPHEKRDQAVYFHYPQAVQDGLRITFPSTLSVEAAPDAAKFNMPDLAAYDMTTTTTPTSFTTRRVFAFNSVIFLPKEYPQLRSFYSQFESNDQQSVILKSPAPITTASTGGN